MGLELDLIKPKKNDYGNRKIGSLYCEEGGEITKFTKATKMRLRFPENYNWFVMRGQNRSKIKKTKKMTWNNWSRFSSNPQIDEIRAFSKQQIQSSNAVVCAMFIWSAFSSIKCIFYVTQLQIVTPQYFNFGLEKINGPIDLILYCNFFYTIL